MQRARFIAGWMGASVLSVTVVVTGVTILGGDNIPTLAVIAILEAACLGLVQQMLVKSRSDRVSAWLLATLAGGVIGRTLQYLLDSGPWMADAYRWPHGLQLAGGACAGLLVGMVMALPQALALRATIPHVEVWIATRALATAATFVFMGIAQFTLGVPHLSFGMLFLTLIAIAWIGALISAAIEGPVISHLLETQRTAVQRWSSLSAAHAATRPPALSDS